MSSEVVIRSNCGNIAAAVLAEEEMVLVTAAGAAIAADLTGAGEERAEGDERG
jgi:hypothetical protein